MILDDLFAAAKTDQANFGPLGGSITVQASVTTNQTGGFKSTGTNKASAPVAITLAYTAAKEIVTKKTVFLEGASFSGPGLTITAPGTNQDYNVTWSGKSFVPSADTTATTTGTFSGTKIVYGSVGSTFVTISLCSYDAVKNTQ